MHHLFWETANTTKTLQTFVRVSCLVWLGKTQAEMIFFFSRTSCKMGSETGRRAGSSGSRARGAGENS